MLQMKASFSEFSSKAEISLPISQNSFSMGTPSLNADPPTWAQPFVVLELWNRVFIERERLSFISRPLNERIRSKQPRRYECRDLAWSLSRRAASLSHQLQVAGSQYLVHR